MRVQNSGSPPLRGEGSAASACCSGPLGFESGHEIFHKRDVSHFRQLVAFVLLVAIAMQIAEAQATRPRWRHPQDNGSTATGHCPVAAPHPYRAPAAIVRADSSRA